MGGRLPAAFGPWVQEQVRSKWFPLRRMVSVTILVGFSVAIAAVGGASLTYPLLSATVVMAVALAASLVFRDWFRRRELRRYQTRDS